MNGKPTLFISKAKDLPEGFSWLNTDRPLSLEDLRGHIVILDFWTSVLLYTGSADFRRKGHRTNELLDSKDEGLPSLEFLPFIFVRFYSTIIA